MAKFFAELKRRHIYRVAAAYAVVAWVLLQIVNNVAPGLNLPNSAVTLVIVLLAIGFPIALIFAWVLELKSPEGQSHVEARPGPFDWVLFAALIAVLIAVSYQQLAPYRPGGIEAAKTAAASKNSSPTA